MSKLLKSLLVAASFVALAPTSALARPPDCYDICDVFTSSCSDVCWASGFGITTCGAYGHCAGVRAEPSEMTASVVEDDASSQVCSEESQSSEQSASVES